MTVDEIIKRDPIVLRAAIAEHLGSLGWVELWAKEQGGVQTLLEHSLAVYDVLVACLPFIAENSFPRLNSDEALTALLAGVAHDAGKADPAFQEYLKHNGPPVEHVDPDEIRRIVEATARAVGVDLGARIEDVVSGAVLHERRMRLGQGELAEWARAHVSPRWRKLADAVNLADSVASSPEVISAAAFLRQSPALTGGAAVASYQVNVRGVSSTYLHDATLAAFEEHGWTAVLYFADGSVLVGRDVLIPSRAEVATQLARRLDRLLSDRREYLPDLAVYDPGKDFLPRPEYVRRDNLAHVLETAARRRRGDKEANPEEAARYREQWKRELDGKEPTQRELQAVRESRPEACVFKIFKNIAQRVFDDEDCRRAARLYDEWLGAGAFDAMLSQGNDKPVEDYISCVRRWHLQSADDGDELKVGDLDPKTRQEKLRTELLRILDAVLAERTAPLRSDTLTDEWAKRCLTDLAMEGAPPSRSSIQQSVDGYAALKAPLTRKGSSPLQCAQCAALILPGDGDGPSDALGNVGTFSNRRLAFAAPGSPPVCKACTVDLTIGQLSLGSRVEAVIALIPRRSLGPAAAREVVGHLRELRHVVDRQLSPQTADLSKYLSLSLPAELLRAAASTASLSECALRQVTVPKTRNKRIGLLEEALKERLGDTGLNDLNNEHGVSYDSVRRLAEAVFIGQVPDSVRSDQDVADAVKAVVRDVLVDFAAVTPNLVVMSLDRKLGGKDDSDADRALYGFGLAALFALEFGMAVVVAPVTELRTALATRAGRTVYVPANGPARRRLGGDWVDLEAARTWLRALQGAIALRERAGARALLEVLSSPSAGFLIRRIEQNGTEETGPWWPGLWSEIEALKEVLG